MQFRRKTDLESADFGFFLRCLKRGKKNERVENERKIAFMADVELVTVRPKRRKKIAGRTEQEQICWRKISNFL